MPFIIYVKIDMKDFTINYLIIPLNLLLTFMVLPINNYTCNDFFNKKLTSF